MLERVDVHRELNRGVGRDLRELPEADRARAHGQVLDGRGLEVVSLDPLVDLLRVLPGLLEVLLVGAADVLVVAELDGALERLDRLLLHRVNVLQVTDQLLVAV